MRVAVTFTGGWLPIADDTALRFWSVPEAYGYAAGNYEAAAGLAPYLDPGTPNALRWKTNLAYMAVVSWMHNPYVGPWVLTLLLSWWTLPRQASVSVAVLWLGLLFFANLYEIRVMFDLIPFAAYILFGLIAPPAPPGGP